MYMMKPMDITIDVNYYVVKDGTDLHQTISDYHNKSVEFVKKVEALVEKYKADSAVRLETSFNASVLGLNFNDNVMPKNWVIGNGRKGLFGFFGSLRPSHKTVEAANDFNHVEMPSFREYASDLMEGVRFGMLGDKVIVSITPNKDGTAPQLADAELITKDQLEELKVNASEKEQEHLQQLELEDWECPAFYKAKIFTPSEELKDFYYKSNQPVNGSRNPVSAESIYPSRVKAPYDHKIPLPFSM